MVFATLMGFFGFPLFRRRASPRAGSLFWAEARKLWGLFNLETLATGRSTPKLKLEKHSFGHVACGAFPQLSFSLLSLHFAHLYVEGTEADRGPHDFLPIFYCTVFACFFVGCFGVLL